MIKTLKFTRRNLKKIDLLFYDSDKRYSSKRKFFKKITNYINENTIIIIDDLHNDSFFFEYIEERGIKNWHVLESSRKHIVGLIMLD